jgi:hypothetical protein
MVEALADFQKQHQNKSDDELLELIGRETHASLAQYEEPLSDALGFSIQENVKQLGRRVYKRLNKELHSLVCGQSAEDDADRKLIFQAIGKNDLILGAALASALISLGAAPLVATPIAVLVVRKVIRPAGEELCAFWSEQLN